MLNPTIVNYSKKNHQRKSAQLTFEEILDRDYHHICDIALSIGVMLPSQSEIYQLQYSAGFQKLSSEKRKHRGKTGCMTKFEVNNNGRPSILMTFINKAGDKKAVYNSNYFNSNYKQNPDINRKKIEKNRAAEEKIEQKKQEERQRLEDQQKRKEEAEKKFNNDLAEKDLSKNPYIKSKKLEHIGPIEGIRDINGTLMIKLSNGSYQMIYWNKNTRKFEKRFQGPAAGGYFDINPYGAVLPDSIDLISTPAQVLIFVEGIAEALTAYAIIREQIKKNGNNLTFFAQEKPGVKKELIFDLSQIIIRACSNNRAIKDEVLKAQRIYGNGLKNKLNYIIFPDNDKKNDLKKGNPGKREALRVVLEETRGRVGNESGVEGLNKFKARKNTFLNCRLEFSGECDWSDLYKKDPEKAYKYFFCVSQMSSEYNQAKYSIELITCLDGYRGDSKEEKIEKAIGDAVCKITKTYGLHGENNHDFLELRQKLEKNAGKKGFCQSYIHSLFEKYNQELLTDVKKCHSINPFEHKPPETFKGKVYPIVHENDITQMDLSHQIVDLLKDSTNQGRRSLVIVQAPKGYGKTKVMINCNQLIQNDSKFQWLCNGVTGLTPRIQLTKDMVTKFDHKGVKQLNSPYLQEEDKRQMAEEDIKNWSKNCKQGNWALTIPSTIHPLYKEGVEKSKSLYVDEVSSIFNYFRSSNNTMDDDILTSNDKICAIKTMSGALRHAFFSMLVDADIGEYDLKSIYALLGESEDLDLYLVKIKEDQKKIKKGEIHSSKNSGFIKDKLDEKILGPLKKGLTVFCTLDSIKDSRNLKDNVINSDLLSENEILLINSDTNKSLRVCKFSNSPDKGKFIVDNGIKLLIATSAMSTGVSIEGDIFNKTVGCFTGDHLPSAEKSQMLARARSTKEPNQVYIWDTKDWQNWTLTEEQIIENQINAERYGYVNEFNLESTAKLPPATEILLKVSAYQVAKRKTEKRHSTLEFFYALSKFRNEDYQVVREDDFCSDKDIFVRDNLRKKKDKIRAQSHHEKIAQAKNIALDEYKQKSVQQILKEEDILAVKKYEIAEMLNIPTDKLCEEDVGFHDQKGGGYVKKIEILAMSDQDCRKKDISNRKISNLTQDTGVYILEKKIMNILLGSFIVNAASGVKSLNEDCSPAQNLIDQARKGTLKRNKNRKRGKYQYNYNYSLGGLSFTSEEALQAIERLKKEGLYTYLQNAHSIDIKSCKYRIKVFKELMKHYFGFEFKDNTGRIINNGSITTRFFEEKLSVDGKITLFEEAFYYYSLSLKGPPNNG